MEPAATIRQLRLEVRTASLALGHELPERLSQLFHASLLAVLTAELARVPGPPRRLAELVLVLPPIAAGQLERELPEELRRALRRALADLNTSAEGSGAADSSGGVAAVPAPPLQGLRYYLLHGYLPWQMGSPGFDLDAAVARAGHQQPQALRALLRQVGQQAWARQRLARQLAPATLDQVIGLLAPADAPIVRAYLRDTLAAHRRRPLVLAAAPALRQVLHELVLADLLAHWHTQFNRRAFVARQLQQLAAHYSLDLVVLLRQLVAVLPLAGPPQSQLPTLPGIVHGLYQQLAPAATASPALAAPVAGADVAAALVYYLRHGSLPPVAGQNLSLAVIAAEAARVVSQGRGTLLALVQAAGVPATAAGLLALLPPGQRTELVRQLAPAQTRPVLALLEELARPPGASVHRSQLWQQAIALLLVAPSAAVLPELRRWLPLQVPGLIAARAAGGAAREQLFQYLLVGLAPVPGYSSPSPAQLRYTLRELVAQRDRSLTDFLRQQLGHQTVLRHLAALAGAALLSQLVPGGTRLRQRHVAARAALAALLGEPAGLAGRAGRQQLLREAYLWFHLRGASGAGVLGSLLWLPAAYGLPAGALLRYLRRQVRQWPIVANSAFFKWLVVGLAGPSARSPAARSLRPATLGAGLPGAGMARLGAASSAARTVDFGGGVGFQTEATAYQLPARPQDAYGRLLVRRHYAAGLRPQARLSAAHLRQPEVSLPELASNAGLPPAPKVRPGQLAAPTAGAYLPTSPHAAPEWLAGSAPHLAWPATATEALAWLATYHPARPTALGEIRPLLRWLAARVPAQVAAWLSAHLLAAPHWPGTAALLDFALLRRLLVGARPASQQALATLAALADQELVASQRLLALLRVTVLLGQFKPTGPRPPLARLAAAYGLPHRATATRLSRLAQRWPALLVLPGWQLVLRALLPDRGAITTRRLAPISSAADPERGAAVAGNRALSPPLTTTEIGSDSYFSPLAQAAEATGATYSDAPGSPAEATRTSQDLLFYYLLHGRAPWWHIGPLLPATLSQALRQAAQPPRPLREFLRQHGRAALVQRHLATLADFSLLHELLPPPGVGRGRRQLVRPALAALDRSLRRPAGTSQERLRFFLQEAYLAYASRPPAATDPLAAARQRAAASGLAWRTVLARVATLLRQHPALAVDPFFAALLQATLAQPAPGGAGRPALAFATVAPVGGSPVTQLGLPAALAGPAEAALPAAEAAWGAVVDYLQTGAAADRAAQLVGQLPPAQAARLLARARPYLSVAAARLRLAALLLPRVGERLLQHWWPARYRLLAQVARGWLHLRRLGLAASEPAGVWDAVLTVALAGGSQPQQMAALLTHLLRAEGAGHPTAQTARQVLWALTRRGQRVSGPLAALLAAHAGGAVTTGGQPSRPPGLSTAAAARPAGPGPALAPGTSAGPGRPSSLQLRPEAAEAGPAATAYVANAGLVLLWPFLAMLFDRLGYLEQRQFKSPELAERATHLLQFLVTGEENFPEYELVLNKLLCGVETARPLARTLLLTPEERSTGEGLLGAVLQRWEVLKNTSVAGLRETFLQRAGRLDYHVERVVLTVETKTLDILLDQRPWSISTIKLPWMPLPLYVTWR